MKIPLSKSYMDEETKEKVIEVLDSGWFILGKNCKEFEKEFAEKMGASHAVLTNSGTSAIMLSLTSLGIKEGDEVLVPSHTAFPTIEPVFHCGAKPVFLDIDDTYTVDPDKIEEKITEKTKAIIVVHIYGHPGNMDEIKEIADKHSLFLVEDCCQAHSAEYKNKKVGTFGDVGCFSFYPSKNMTVAGDGGILITNNSDIAEKVRMLRNHGRKDKYLHELVGYNLRFNEVQAAIGRIQLQKLDSFNNMRRKNSQIYNEKLKDLPITLPSEKEWAKSVYHLYVIRTEKRDELAEFLKQNGIATGVHYPIPNHLQPAVKNLMKTTELPVTEKIVNEIISLPMFPELKEEEIEYICEKIKECLNN